MVGAVASDEAALFEVEGLRAWVCDDHRLDFEGRVVYVALGDAWEADENASSH